MKYYIRDEDISGRIFIKEKVLSFWTYPKTYKDYMKVLKDIENNINIKFDNTWKLELPREQYEFVDDDYPGELVNIYNYRNNIKRNKEEMKILHLMNVKEKDYKKHGKVKSFGSNKIAWDSRKNNIAWRQAKRLSENKNMTFKN